MKTTDEYKQKLLAELIEQSVKIDGLIVKIRQATEDEKLIYDQALDALRIKQKEVTQKLQQLAEPNSNAWENIGDGG
jgi:hypothetical protein